jgi:chemotaxis protein CheX
LGLLLENEAVKVEYINPFIESVQDLFTTMLRCRAQRTNIGITKRGGEARDIRDIMALIGLSGPIRGTVALVFPVSTALAMVSRLVGSDQHVVDETVLDAVAEMVNMVAGGAKTKLKKADGVPIDLGLPTVVRGQSYMVAYSSHSVWLDVPFSSELGAFNLRVNFELAPGR